jgi:hypothetical protein
VFRVEIAEAHIGFRIARGCFQLRGQVIRRAGGVAPREIFAIARAIVIPNRARERLIRIELRGETLADCSGMKSREKSLIDRGRLVAEVDTC